MLEQYSKKTRNKFTTNIISKKKDPSETAEKLIYEIVVSVAKLPAHFWRLGC